MSKFSEKGYFVKENASVRYCKKNLKPKLIYKFLNFRK